MGIREFGIGSAAQGWLWIGTLLSIYQFLSPGIDMNYQTEGMGCRMVSEICGQGITVAEHNL